MSVGEDGMELMSCVRSETSPDEVSDNVLGMYCACLYFDYAAQPLCGIFSISSREKILCRL